MTRYSEELKSSAGFFQSIFRQNRIAKTRFHQSFNGFRICCFHDYVRNDMQFFKESVNQCPHIALLRIDQEWSLVELSRINGTDEIGRASCRERVKDTVGAVYGKKK